MPAIQISEQNERTSRRTKGREDKYQVERRMI